MVKREYLVRCYSARLQRDKSKIFSLLGLNLTKSNSITIGLVEQCYEMYILGRPIDQDQLNEMKTES